MRGQSCPAGRVEFSGVPATDILGDGAIRAAIKAATPDGTPTKRADGAGLHLVARPTGSGWWRVRYSQDGREGMLSLAVAGLPAAGTFEAVPREWLDNVHLAKVSADHAERTRARLEHDVFPYLGRHPIADLATTKLLPCLRRIEARGAIETAHRAKDACGQVFRYGIAAGHCARNQAADLRDPLQPVEPPP
jgi:hypothetical protein